MGFRSLPLEHGWDGVLTISRRTRKLLSFYRGKRVYTCHILAVPCLLFFLLGFALPAVAEARPACFPNGDVDRNGSITVADALLALQQAMGQPDLNDCQQGIADVFPGSAAPDGAITASDAFCILRRALGISSCLDGPRPSDGQPAAHETRDEMAVLNMGPERFETAGLMKSGVAAADPAPVPSVHEKLAFLISTPQNGGLIDGAGTSVTRGTGTERFVSVSAGYYHTCGGGGVLG